jgi:PleD family two-component response regulator
MSHALSLLYFSAGSRAVPASVSEFAERAGFSITTLPSAGEVLEGVSRAYPAAVVLDGSEPAEAALELCRQMKAEPFTAVVPVIVYVHGDGPDIAADALEAGADEVLTPRVSERETELRLLLALRRAQRDVSVHPTTRLPGTVQIERDFAERLRTGGKFAVCYADLDNFKEFNDRYGYHQGDRVILIVSKILRDVVRAYSPTGFVGHIGGDDFIFSVPLADMKRCCELVLEVFDTLVPYQYAESDRDQGFFIGKDRRGNPFQVPLMTLSIGVVTNEKRTLTHPAEIGELATEMKSYAKTFTGSLYVVDRRTKSLSSPPFEE